MNVLVIEDDKRIASIVERALSENGHSVRISHNGRDGAELLVRGRFEIALLDVLLPGMNGFDVLQSVRNRHCKTPIVMLTAVDEVPSIVQALEMGADDYLVKPFILEILLARVAAVARRVQKLPRDESIDAAGLRLDPNRRTVQFESREISLTRKQMDLLYVLMRRNGLLTTREDLIEAAWRFPNEVKHNVLDVYIHGLRVKLDELTNNEHDNAVQKPTIRTIHGEGYMFVAD